MSELSIHQAMAAVLKDLPAIGKNQRNQQQGYQFRGIDDVIDALNPLLAKHGVFFVPDVIERIESARQTRNGGTMWVVNLHVRYTFYGPRGDFVTATAWGEGTDSGDKATQKAMTGAMKYVLFQVFAIATHEQAEADSDRTTPAPSARRSTKSAGTEPAGRDSDPHAAQVRPNQPPGPVSARMSTGAGEGSGRTGAAVPHETVDQAESPVSVPVPVPPSGATAVAVQAPTPAQESELSTDNEWTVSPSKLAALKSRVVELNAEGASVSMWRSKANLPPLSDKLKPYEVQNWDALLDAIETFAAETKANA